MSLLAPIKHALAAVLATAHDALTGLGASPDSGFTWILAIGLLVIAVRGLMLPFAVYAVRSAHSAARARPHLRELTERYRGRTDPAAARELLAERRKIAGEHNMSRLGCLPLLLQLPIWIGLYHLMSDVARGDSLGAMTPTLVASLGSATVFGVPLADSGFAGNPTHVAVVVGLAGLAATLSFLTQHFFVLPNMVTDGMPEQMQQAQRIMPTVSALGMLFMGTVAPLGLLVYWVWSSAWTMAQSATVWRWFPTPGSGAAERNR